MYRAASGRFHGDEEQRSKAHSCHRSFRNKWKGRSIGERWISQDGQLCPRQCLNSADCNRDVLGQREGSWYSEKPVQLVGLSQSRCRSVLIIRCVALRSKASILYPTVDTPPILLISLRCPAYITLNSLTLATLRINATRSNIRARVDSRSCGSFVPNWLRQRV